MDGLLLLLLYLSQVSQLELDLPLQLFQQEQGLQVFLLCVHQAVLLA